MTVADVYELAETAINGFLRETIIAQGHSLIGELHQTLHSTTRQKGKTDVMQGFAVHYMKYVNDGVPAKSASFKQFPFLVEYFKKRGISDDKEAKAAAAATIHKWMKEGLSTKASSKYSETGKRQQIVENTFADHGDKIDGVVMAAFDQLVDEQYHKEKSETI